MQRPHFVPPRYLRLCPPAPQKPTVTSVTGREELRLQRLPLAPVVCSALFVLARARAMLLPRPYLSFAPASSSSSSGPAVPPAVGFAVAAAACPPSPFISLPAPK